MRQRYIVIALIYSGRPDPRWELNEEGIDQFIKRWEELPNSNNEVELPSISGYKGLRLQTAEKNFIIYNEQITCFEKTSKISKKDAERKLEIFLLNSAPDEISVVLQKFDIPG